MASSTISCGPDTLHLTFREGGGRSPEELSGLLGEFQRQYVLPTSTVQRDRGLSGFAAAAIDKAAGFRLDWTRPGEEGTNPGYFCLQVQGTWFEQADGETAADLLQLLEAYGPLRATRLDFQQTIRTKTELTPWWIDQFERGHLRVLGRKHYEPRGRKDADGGYPFGATLYHGSRTSERFARQYDKHLQQNSGEPRRRDEIEIKGQACRDLWADLQQQLIDGEQQGIARGASLHSFAKRSIRAFLPIRDTSRWTGQKLPQNWAQMASEPLTWSNLFDEDALTIKPRERTVSSLLKSYRYAKENFGAAITVTALLRRQEHEQEGLPGDVAHSIACQDVLDEMVLEARPEKVQEFASEFHIEKAAQITSAFLAWREGAERRVETEEHEVRHPRIEK
jgi:hypothetical protein